jgi:hypothetical protein
LCYQNMRQVTHNWYNLYLLITLIQIKSYFAFQ